MPNLQDILEKYTRDDGLLDIGKHDHDVFLEALREAYALGVREELKK